MDDGLASGATGRGGREGGSTRCGAGWLAQSLPTHPPRQPLSLSHHLCNLTESTCFGASQVNTGNLFYSIQWLFCHRGVRNPFRGAAARTSPVMHPSIHPSILHSSNQAAAGLVRVCPPSPLPHYYGDQMSSTSSSGLNCIRFKFIHRLGRML